MQLIHFLQKTPRASYCYALRCADLNNLDYSQTSGAFDVYKIKAIPVMDQTAGRAAKGDSCCLFASLSLTVNIISGPSLQNTLDVAIT